MGRSYDRDELQAILARALDREHASGDKVSHEELLAIGRELGVSEDAIEEATRSLGDEVAVQKLVDARVRRERAGLLNHLLSFVLVNALLAVVNLTIGGPLWFLWSVFGWGIGLAFHARAAAFPDRERIAARERKRLEKQREREEREREREERRARASELERNAKRLGKVVEEGVADVLGVVADAIEEARRESQPHLRVDPPKARVDAETDEARPEEETAEEEASERARARRSRP